MKILITGASGLVGARLVEFALGAGHQVVQTYNEHHIESNSAFRVDIRNEKEAQKVVKDTSPDVIVHLASITDVDFCEREPKIADSVNASATRTLAEECFNVGGHFVYVSTDYVFDGSRGHYTESDRPNPANTYGRSKLKGEEFTRVASETFCVVRTSVVYGWGRKSRQNFGSWMYAELKAGRPVEVVKNQYCSPTLNSQLARMLLEVAQNRLPGTIHLAGASRLSRYDFARLLANEFNFETKLIVPIDADSSAWFAKRPLDSSLNVARAQELLSNKPVDIRSALSEFAGEKSI